MTVGAVSDAGPLIHLADIGSCEPLTIFDPLLIPPAVYEEVEAGGVPAELSELPYERVSADVDPGGAVADELDAGERAAIAVAGERGLVLLTADLAARNAAASAGIEVHGSIGVRALGYGRGVFDRDEAASRMRALQRERSLFVTDAVVERGIRMLDQP